MTARKEASPFRIAHDQDMRTKLVARIVALGERAVPSKTIGVDVGWMIDTKPVMLDLKTAEDLIASVDDGRLHAQSTYMREQGCEVWGFCLEGNIHGDGVVVGRGPAAWPVERFDNLLLSLQAEGAVIIHSPSQARTAERLVAMYNWTRKDTHGSWHRPQKKQHAMHDVYTNRAWRECIEFLMGLPDMGEVTANALIDRWPLMDILGVTPEGLAAAKKRWASVRGIGPKSVATWEGRLLEDFSSPLLRGSGD